MKNWCKIIETKDHDVLVQRLSDDEDGEHVNLSIKVDGVFASYKLYFGNNESEADKAFNDYGLQEAKKMVANTLKILTR